MAGNLHLELATPERLLLSEEVTEVVVPAASGYVGILPSHAPLVAQLGSGELSYTLPGGGRKFLAVHGGFLEVSNDHVRVLADAAENPGEIDLARAQAALKRAEERVAHLPPGVDIARAINAMRRAQARLAAAKAGC